VLRFSVSAKVCLLSTDQDWWLSTIYGHVRDEDRPTFFEELHTLRHVHLGPWLICGDFNMIYRAQNKNKGKFFSGHQTKLSFSFGHQNFLIFLMTIALNFHSFLVITICFVS
jgi:hypothetical protein